MFRRLFAILFALVAALLGAVLGKAVADLRRKSEAGEALHVDMDVASVRPRDVMPGLVAALRVQDRPWSYLHIPSWVAAFSVNFAFAALASELGPLLSALRGEDEPGDERDWQSDATSWTAEPASSLETRHAEPGLDPV